MHRTQIYLQDSLHARLKLRAKGLGLSVSELIRRTLDNEVARDPVADAVAFFDRLTPLKGFSTDSSQTPEDYVRESREKSRLLRVNQAEHGPIG